MRGVMTAVVGMLAVVLMPTETSGPWSPVPEGWVYLQQEGIDSWMGTYHDRVSGACVHFDVAFPFVVKPLAESTEQPPPIYSGVPFNLTVKPHGSCVEGRRLSASFFPEGDDSTSIVWNLYADTCGSNQYERTRDFLFGMGGQPRARPENEDLGRLHSRKELEAVAVGRSFAGIRDALGATSSAECHPDGSFTANWVEDSRPHYKDWEFRFNQDQVMIQKKRP